MQTKEELNVVKNEVETVSSKLRQLNENELAEVTGGVEPICGSGVSGGSAYKPSIPKTAPTPSTPTESFTIPIKGEDTVHIDASVRDGKVIITETLKSDI